jgi:hypothetical protein
MAKWADYLISGVWFLEDENHKHVSHVNLHLDNDSKVGSGKKTAKEDVIALIEKGNTVKTIRWIYQSRLWDQGALVDVYHLNRKNYLRTVPDASESDNLDNMLPMDNLAP